MKGTPDMKTSVKIALSLVPGIIFVVVLIVLVVQIDEGTSGMAEVSMSDVTSRAAASERATVDPA